MTYSGCLREGVGASRIFQLLCGGGRPGEEELLRKNSMLSESWVQTRWLHFLGCG